MELVHSGKVRDLYADGDDIILVASDRVSVYDVILLTPIPDKGKSSPSCHCGGSVSWPTWCRTISCPLPMFRPSGPGGPFDAAGSR